MKEGVFEELFQIGAETTRIKKRLGWENPYKLL